MFSLDALVILRAMRLISLFIAMLILADMTMLITTLGMNTAVGSTVIYMHYGA